MKSGTKHRRAVLLFLTLIAVVLLIAFATAPLLLSFLLGALTGGAIVFFSIVTWLLKS